MKAPEQPAPASRATRRTPRLSFLIAVLVAGLAAWLALRWWADNLDRAYDRVEKGLYIGRAVDSPPRGAEAVLNLCGRRDPYSLQASLWEPILEDDKEPTVEWLERVVGFVAEQRRDGRTVYVHCFAGQNRSGAVVTAYLMQEHGWSRDKALAFLKERRPQVQPNLVMMRLLDKWQERLEAQANAGRRRLK